MPEELPPLATHYDKESWLRRAMEVLAREGKSKLSTESLAKDLGVTRGSFYHHFKNREDFVRSLLRFWASNFTAEIVSSIQSSSLTPEERVLHLMRLIRDERIDRYDIALRGWAAEEPNVAEELRKVDEARYLFVRKLFEDLGFQGADLEERTRLFVVYESKQFTAYFPSVSRDIPDSIERRFAIYTAKKSGGL